MKFQRDAFISVIHEAAKSDPNILFLSADFGAPALDKFRADLPGQFIHMGISEQNLIDVAAGLALDGRKVFCYAMAPFVSLRAMEQHKCSTALMNLPVCTIVAGIGLGYADAGPTHYATEDLTCLSSIIGATIYTASDANVAKQLAQVLIGNPQLSFVRLDRHASDDMDGFDAHGWFRVWHHAPMKELAIITQGRMVKRCLEAVVEAGAWDTTAVFDLIRSKPLPSQLIYLLSDYRQVLIVEEQTPPSSIAASLVQAGIVPHSRSVMMLCDRYYFENGGRDHLLEIGGLSVGQIARRISEMVLDIERVEA